MEIPIYDISQNHFNLRWYLETFISLRQFNRCKDNVHRQRTAEKYCFVYVVQTGQSINYVGRTCFDSTAAVYSLPKVSSVIATSSSMMLKSRARSVSSLRTSRLTCWRWVMSCEALNLATTLFSTWNRHTENVIKRLCAISLCMFLFQKTRSSTRLRTQHTRWLFFRRLHKYLIANGRQNAFVVVDAELAIHRRQLHGVRPWEHSQRNVYHLQIWRQNSFYRKWTTLLNSIYFLLIKYPQILQLFMQCIILTFNK